MNRPLPTVAWDADRVAAIIEAHAGLEGPLLPILHAIQAAFGHVPQGAIPLIAFALNLTRAEVHGVATFYHDFRPAPAGRRHVQLCRAEACQARGARQAQARLEAALEVPMGETRADGAITLEAIYCLGLCASGPAALVDGAPVARLSGARLERLISEVSA